MFRKILLIFTLLCLVLTCGCWDLREINAGIVSTMVGIELVNNKIVFSIQVLQPTIPGESGSSKNEPVVVSTEDYTVTMAARRLMLSLSLTPEWAHGKTFIIGERLARNSLYQCMDFLSRNRNIRPDHNIMISVDATPEEVLSSQLPEGINLGVGLMDTLTQSERMLGIYVPITVEEFTYRLSTPGIEPAVPQVTLISENNSDGKTTSANAKQGGSSPNKPKPVLDGMAVFKRNKMVGSLNEYESRGYRWLASSSKQGGFFTIKSPLNPNQVIGLEIVNFNSKVKPRISGDNIQMNIEVDAKLGFYEEAGTGELLTPAATKKLEQAADQEIKRQIVACINRSQALQSDILGWGQAIHTNQPEKWKELYPQWGRRFPSVESNVQVKTQIERSGLSTKSFKFQ